MLSFTGSGCAEIPITVHPYDTGTDSVQFTAI
jgi:hypothetical protein